MGSLFRPKYPPAGMSYADAKAAGLLRESAVWWVKYRANGKTLKESSESTKESDAKKLLRQREGAVIEGRVVIPRADRVTVGVLLDELKQEYETNERRSVERLGFSLARLRPFFGHFRAVRLTSADVTRYKAARQAEGVANATINRELAALKRALSLAHKAERITRAPYIAMLEEHNVRTGFFERGQFEAVRARLPEYLRPVVTFAYLTGWRTKSEILPLEWRQIDFKAGTVCLDSGTTKNGEGRTFVMTPELRACLEAQRTLTEEVQKRTKQIIPSVFHRNGKPIKDYRSAWQTACEAAGVPGRIPHDFRRTAVRNLERAGVSRSVAMKLTGHKSEAVYQRYAIVNEQDLHEAAAKLATAERGRVIVGQVLGQVVPASK
jgi:integrase